MRLTAARSLTIDLIFFATGFGTVLLGVLAPLLFAGRVNDAGLAQMFLSLFLGTIAGSLLLWGHPAQSLLRGLAVCTLGAILLAVHASGLGWLFLFGMGLGMSMTSANLLAAGETEAANRASRLEFANFSWALGAMVCPWVTVWAVRVVQPGAMFGFLAVFFVILCGAFLCTRAPAMAAVGRAAEGTERSLPALVLCCLLALLAVGVETAVGNWIPTLAFRSTGDHRAISLAGSLFWIGILAGRLLATRTMKSVSPVILSVASSLLAALSVLFLTRSHGLAALCAGAFLVSFWISPVYPATIARGGPLRGRRLIFVTAGLGSSFLPWMTGLLSERSGSLRTALAVPAVGCVLLAGLFLADMKLAVGERRTATGAGG